MDPLTKEQRHKNMSHIRSKDTSIEVALRKALWHKGYRYRGCSKIRKLLQPLNHTYFCKKHTDNRIFAQKLCKNLQQNRSTPSFDLLYTSGY